MAATQDQALTVRADRTISDPTEERRLLRQLILKNASEEQTNLVIGICDRYGFDPMLKHVVIVSNNLYVTRDGLLHLAHQSGQFDGIEVEMTQLQGGEWVATCTVYRKDMSRPIRYSAFESEHKPANTANSAWAKYPRAMLQKCFDEETEILTTNGFEQFSNVWGDVLHVTDRGLERTTSRPFSQDYDGPMVAYDNQNLDFRVTPNHDMVTTAGKIEAGVLHEQARSRAQHYIPRLVQGGPDNAPVTDQEIDLIAAYLTDGVDASGGSFAVSVSRPRKIERLREIGGYYSEITQPTAGQEAHTATRTITTQADKVRFLYNRSLVAVLCGPNKTIEPERILTLSQYQAQRLVDGMLFFDGHEARTARRFFSSRLDHVAAFELAAVVAGYSISPRKERQSDIGTKPNYVVTISANDAVPVIRRGREYQGHGGQEAQDGLYLTPNTGGKVWCVTVPSGVIVVRRHGFSMLCGNCAEVMALRRAFDVSVGAAEEIGYDGINPQTNAGRVTVIEAAPAQLPGRGTVVHPQPAPPPLPAQPLAEAAYQEGVDAFLACAEDGYSLSDLRKQITDWDPALGAEQRAEIRAHWAAIKEHRAQEQAATPLVPDAITPPPADTLGWTEAWSWFRAKGFADRKAIDAFLGKSTQGLTPGEIKAAVEAQMPDAQEVAAWDAAAQGESQEPPTAAALAASDDPFLDRAQDGGR